MIRQLANLYNTLKIQGRVIEAEELLDLIVEAGYDEESSDDWKSYTGADDYKDPRVQEPAPKAERSFKVPSQGLTSVRNLNRHFKTREPETADRFDWERATVPRPGTWNQNNGTIAICDGKGRIFCWINNGGKSRTYSYEKTMDAILDAGFEQQQFYVPFSS
jgi:hypothetical protein